ncbi:MAG: riboflavin synthase [Candidatus Latescibacterota bacterium]|nr:MAG: riboflavin synthase [Candidatus Latescibacterota bacterium]
MFTGIIEEVGCVRAVTPQQNGVELQIDASRVAGDLAPGASIAVDGVCQTVLDADARGFRVAAEAETLRVTSLGALRTGSRVNLERALAVGGRLDGHLVLGHVDGRARIVGMRRDARTHVLELEVSLELRPYVVAKGCIAVDGVSLTVGPRVDAGRFELYLIPYTWEHTTLHERRVGDRVNVETDVLARYVVHLLRGKPERSDLTWENLQRAFGGP